MILLTPTSGSKSGLSGTDGRTGPFPQQVLPQRRQRAQVRLFAGGDDDASRQAVDDVDGRAASRQVVDKSGSGNDHLAKPVSNILPPAHPSHINPNTRSHQHINDAYECFKMSELRFDPYFVLVLVLLHSSSAQAGHDAVDDSEDDEYLHRDLQDSLVPTQELS